MLRGARGARLGMAAAAAAIALGGLAGCSDDDDPTITPGPTSVSQEPSATPSAVESSAPASPTAAAFDGTEIQVTVVGGKAQTPQSRVTVERGEKVRLVVTADVADHVHVHTYDLMEDTVPGQPVTIEWQASIPGTHEIELEDAGLRLLELSVR